MAEHQTSKSATILYRPVGLNQFNGGGLLAAILVNQVWRRAAAGQWSHPPEALDRHYPLKEILFAAALEASSTGRSKR